MVQSMIQGLIKIAEVDDKVLFLVVDDIEPYEGLKRYVPERTFLIGIAECNAINMAAGLANCGYKPYVIGGDSFLAYRGYEFIRSQVCLDNRNVKMIGIGAGMAIGVHGSMHTATEDVSILRALPNLAVITPATPSEVKYTMEAVNGIDGPMFIRLGRSCGEDFYLDANIAYSVGKIQEIKKGSDLLIIGHGSIVCDAIAAVFELSDYAIGVASLSTVKPIDVEGLCGLSKRYKNWLTIEEHNLNGGLGSAVAEVIVDNNLDVRLSRMGLCDTFSRATGGHADIKKKNGLDVSDIKERCKCVLEEK